MAEVIRQSKIWVDRARGKDEVWSKKVKSRAIAGLEDMPPWFTVMVAGFGMRFESQEARESYVDDIVREVQDTGYANPWYRRSFALFLDGPTRIIANHRIDHAVMESMGYLYRSEGEN